MKSWGLHLAVVLVLLVFAVKGYAYADDVCAKYVKKYDSHSSIFYSYTGPGKRLTVYELFGIGNQDNFSLYAQCPPDKIFAQSAFWFVDGKTGEKTKVTVKNVGIAPHQAIITVCGEEPLFYEDHPCNLKTSLPSGSYFEAVTTCCTGATVLEIPIFDVSSNGVTTPRTGTSLVPDNRMPNPVNEPARVPSWLTQPVPPAPGTAPVPLTR